MYTLLAGLIVLQAVSALVIVRTLGSSGEAAMRRQASQLMLAHAERAIQRAQSFLEPVEVSATMTAQLMADGTIPSGLAPSNEQYLLSMLTSNPSIAGAYIATSDGGFLYVKRDSEVAPNGYRVKRIDTRVGRRVTLTWRDARFRLVRETTDPEDRFDPRVRPWYQQARVATKTTWTAPYVFFSSRRPGLTAAMAVRRGTELTGVVGVDMELSALSTFLSGHEISPHGRAMITNTSGEVIALSGSEDLSRPVSDDQLRLATTSEVSDRVVQTLAATARPEKRAGGRAHILRFSHGGDAHLGVVEQFAIGGQTWMLTVFAPDSDFTGTIRQSQRRGTLLSAAIAGVSTIGAILLALSVFGPMRRWHRHATTDAVTGLATRAHLDEQATLAFAAARSTGTPLAAAMLDIDNFKKFNDAYGHAVGDTVLRNVADQLRDCFRKSDIIGRFAGDEFTVVMPGTSHEEACAVAQRLIGEIAKVEHHHNLPEAFTASVGVASLSTKHQSVRDLIEAADRALLRAKASGRNQVAAVRDEPVRPSALNSTGS